MKTIFKYIFLLTLSTGAIGLQAMEKPRNAEAREEIRREIQNAHQEGRDFAFAPDRWKHLVEVLSRDTFVAVLIDAIRDNEVGVYDEPREQEGDYENVITKAKNSVAKLEKRGVKWVYNVGNPAREVVMDASDGIALCPPTTALELGNSISGFERFNQIVYCQQSRKTQMKTPQTNWLDNELLTRQLNYFLENSKDKKKALTRSAIRGKLSKLNSSNYPTSFPIPIVMWFLHRESSRQGHPIKFLDPCMGWGCRLTGSLLVGKEVCSHYYGIDPWDVSHQICERILRIFSNEHRCAASLVKATAQQEADWVDVDLVFTSPPYGKVECYNLEARDESDGQAWRLVDDGTFVSHFIRPMLIKAAKATRALNGHVIINIGNDLNDEKGCAFLTDSIVEEALGAGLVLVETIGMTKGTQLGRGNRGGKLPKGEPIFIFGHPPFDDLETRLSTKRRQTY